MNLISQVITKIQFEVYLTGHWIHQAMTVVVFFIVVSQILHTLKVDPDPVLQETFSVQSLSYLMIDQDIATQTSQKLIFEQ